MRLSITPDGPRAAALGSKGGGVMLSAVAERFWLKVARSDDPSACWLWTGALKQKYGRFRLFTDSTGKRVDAIAHRVAWELVNGPIPAGKVICHRCDNPPCCNPSHLFVGTMADNMRDMAQKGRGRSGTAKLDAEALRRIHETPRTRAAREPLAAELGVSVRAIEHAQAGRTWRPRDFTPPAATEGQ